MYNIGTVERKVTKMEDQNAKVVNGGSAESVRRKVERFVRW